jgi:hypothetical protein
MPAKDHAAWDIVTENVTTPRRFFRKRNTDFSPFARDRTALFGPNADPAAIREDYTSRIKNVQPIKTPLVERMEIPFVFLTLLLLLYWVWVGGSLLRQPASWTVPALGLMAYLSNANLRHIRRTINRFVDRHCPDCNYDLSASHADPPLDPESLGINLGPRHCPECGALWPLVPPPIPTPPTS